MTQDEALRAKYVAATQLAREETTLLWCRIVADISKLELAEKGRPSKPCSATLLTGMQVGMLLQAWMHGTLSDDGVRMLDSLVGSDVGNVVQRMRQIYTIILDTVQKGVDEDKSLAALRVVLMALRVKLS